MNMPLSLFCAVLNVTSRPSTAEILYIIRYHIAQLYTADCLKHTNEVCVGETLTKYCFHSLKGNNDNSH